MDDNDALYVGDYALTLKMTSNIYPAYTVDTETQVCIGGDSNEYPLFHQCIEFVVDDHMSHISVVIHVKITEEDDVDNHFAQLSFNCNSMEKMDLRQLTEEEETLTVPEVEKREGNIFFLLTLTGVQLARVSATRIFVENTVFDRFRSLLVASDEYQIVIRGSERIVYDYTQLRQAFSQERSRQHFRQWFAKSPHRYFIQKGAIIDKEDRPTYTLPRRLSFFEWPDYLCTLGFAMVQEEEGKAQGTRNIEESTRDVIFITMPFTNIEHRNKRLYCLIPVLGETEARLTAHDSITINFDPEIDDQTQDWHGVITEPLPWCPMDMVTAIVTCTWSQEQGGWAAPDVTHAMSYERLTDLTNTFRALSEAQTVPVKIKVITSDKTFSRNVVALEKINSGNLRAALNRELFLANNFVSLKHRDLYEKVREEFPEPERVMRINAQQRQAVHRASNAPEGLTIVIGPPGTGKTYLAIQMCTPFLLAEEPRQILLCSHSNQAVDELAADAMKHIDTLRNEYQMKTHMVVRFHSLESEEEVVIWDAKKRRKVPAQARPPLFHEVSNEDEALLRQVENAYIMWEHHARHTTQRFQGIRDPRLVLMQSSLGWRMLEVAGVIESEFADPPETFDLFREAMRQYRNDVEWGSQAKAKFNALKRELFERTIQKASVLCCSLSNSATTIVFENFNPEFIVLDEAARATEPDCWTLWANYAASGILLIGDPRQLQPHVETRSRKAKETNMNGFAEQLGLSLMSRLESGGFPTTTMVEQNRAVPAIAKTYSKAFYNDSLTNGPQTAINLRSITRQISQYNTNKYRKSSPLIFFDVTKGKGQKVTVRSSLFNEMNAKLGINLVYDLMTTVGMNSSNITIITPYLAQVRVYRSALERMNHQHPTLLCSRVEVASVDSYQGKKNSIVILDLVVTQSLGFLSDMNRLVVASSRARDALYVIANKACIDNSNPRAGRFMKRYLSQILPQRYFVAQDDMDCSYYASGDIDLAAIHDEFPEADAEFNLPIEAVNVEQSENNIEDQPTGDIHLLAEDTTNTENNVEDQSEDQGWEGGATQVPDSGW